METQSSPNLASALHGVRLPIAAPAQSSFEGGAITIRIHSSANLEERTTPASALPAPVVSPTRLLALLDITKAYPLLRQHHPETVAQVEARAFAATSAVMDLNDYEVRIQGIFRFNPEDTLVFHVRLRSKSDREIR